MYVRVSLKGKSTSYYRKFSNKRTSPNKGTPLFFRTISTFLPISQLIIVRFSIRKKPLEGENALYMLNAEPKGLSLHPVRLLENLRYSFLTHSLILDRINPIKRSSINYVTSKRAIFTPPPLTHLGCPKVCDSDTILMLSLSLPYWLKIYIWQGFTIIRELSWTGANLQGGHGP